MKKKPERSPADLPLDPPGLVDANSVLSSGIQIAEHVIRGLRLDAPMFASMRLEACIFESSAIPRAVVRSAKWRDVRFAHCDLANVEIRGMMAVRVELAGCKMTGFQANEGNWQSLLISGGDQRYAQFRFSTFKTSEFEDCDFEEADFYGADLQGAIFRRCNLSNVEMSKVKLAGADLRGSNVEGLRIGPEELRGAIVDAAQALAFAPLLGIEIR